MNLMRVYQTAGLIPQRLLFFLAVFADVHNLWRLVNAFAVYESPKVMDIANLKKEQETLWDESASGKPHGRVDLSDELWQI